ncbi:MAG: SDR family NAD(P)-dependent oxidoreductase [Anaerolineae bacterium]|nr:SDR family NAD(P)-dependent oxidoreductase [Anaerolineae bacterium]
MEEGIAQRTLPPFPGTRPLWAAGGEAGTMIGIDYWQRRKTNGTRTERRMQVVIVTGASRGLGAATARILLEMGAAVVLNARSAGDLNDLAAKADPGGGRSLVVAGDVSDEADCAALVGQTMARFDRLDALVNNAGVLQPVAPLGEEAVNAWRQNLAVNLLGPYYLMYYALPHLKASGGRVVNVSSGAAVNPVPGWSAYSTAKAAINMLTRALAEEAPEVTALAFRPGVVDTAMQAAIREEGNEGMPAERHERFVRLHEQGELLPPEQPGRSLALLALYAPLAWSGEFVQWDEERVLSLGERGAKG